MGGVRPDREIHDIFDLRQAGCHPSALLRASLFAMTVFDNKKTGW